MPRLFGVSILPNHPLKCEETNLILVMSLDKTCQAQLLVDAAERGSEGRLKRQFISDEEAEFSYAQVGTEEKGWLAFQGYYDEQLMKTNGSFLK